MAIKPRELETIRKETQASSVTPTFTEDVKTHSFLSQSLTLFTNYTAQQQKQETEKKDVLSRILQELEKTGSHKETQRIVVPEGKQEESHDMLKNISKGIATLVDMFTPFRENMESISAISQKHLDTVIATEKSTKARHAKVTELAAKQHKELILGLKDLDEDLEYATEKSRKEELRVSDEDKKDKKGGGDLTTKLAEMLGLKPMLDFAKYIAPVVAGFASLAGLKFAAIVAGITAIGYAAKKLYDFVIDLDFTNKNIKTREKESEAQINKWLDKEKQYREMESAGLVLTKEQTEHREKNKKAAQNALKLEQQYKAVTDNQGVKASEAISQFKEDPSLGSGLYASKETIGSIPTALGVAGITAAISSAAIKAKRGIESSLKKGADYLFNRSGKSMDAASFTRLSTEQTARLKPYMDASKEVAEEVSKSQGRLAKMFKSLKEAGSGFTKFLKTHTSDAMSYIKESAKTTFKAVSTGAGKIKDLTKGVAQSTLKRVGDFSKSLGKRGSVNVGVLKDVGKTITSKVGSVVKAVTPKASKALEATGKVLKGTAAKAGAIVAAGFAVHEASGLAGEGDYLGAAKALAKGGFSFLGGAVGGALGTAAGPVGTVAGAVGGSMAAEKAFEKVFGPTASSKKPRAALSEEEQNNPIFARRERYNELLEQGVSAADIREIIRDEFPSLNKEKTVSGSIEQATETIVESQKSTTEEDTNAVIAARRERYNELLEQGVSAADIREIIRDEFPSLNKEKTVSGSIEQATETIVESQRSTTEEDTNAVIAARRERYNELLKKGVSAAEISRTIQKEFPSLNKEKTVSGSIEQATENKTLNAIVELKEQAADISETEVKRDKDKTDKLDNWFEKILQFFKIDFFRGLSAVVGFGAMQGTQRAATPSYSGSVNLQPQLGAITPGLDLTVQEQHVMAPASMPDFTATSMQALMPYAGVLPTDITAHLDTSEEKVGLPDTGDFTSTDLTQTTNIEELPTASASTPVDSSLGQELLRIGASRQVWADPGYCARGTRNILGAAGINIPGANAKDLAGVFSSDDRFREISAGKYLQNVPPGAVFVMQPRPGARPGQPRLSDPGRVNTSGMHTYGHTGIVLGGGWEVSDKQRRLSDSRNYGELRAFVPVAKKKGETPQTEGGIPSVPPAPIPASTEDKDALTPPQPVSFAQAMLSAGTSAVATIADKLPGVPEDMKTAMSQMTNLTTEDFYTSGAEFFRRDPDWASRKGKMELTGSRMSAPIPVEPEEAIIPTEIKEDIVEPTPVYPRETKTPVVAKVSTPAIKAPEVTEQTPEANTASQMAQMTASMMQLVNAAASIPQQMAGSAGAPAQQNSSPTIDDISLQMLQKFFFMD